MRKLGFTLIELLIVIAILGILAVAVLAALNPVEQINRGRDTGSISDAEQLLGAIDRYHTFKGHYPWAPSAAASQTDNAIGIIEVNGDLMVNNLAGCAVLTRLGSVTSDTPAGCTNANELKTGFTNRISAKDYNPLWIYNRGQRGDSTYICFEPQSQEFAAKAAERCALDLPDDFPGRTCTNVAEPYYCLP